MDLRGCPEFKLTQFLIDDVKVEAIKINALISLFIRKLRIKIIKATY